MTGEADNLLSQRVDAAIAEYLESAEQGAPPDREAFLARHVEIADRLREFLGDYSAVKCEAPKQDVPAIAPAPLNDILTAQCPNGHPLRIAAKLAGRRVKCPKCEAAFVVPASSQPIPATPPKPIEKTEANCETLSFKTEGTDSTNTPSLSAPRQTAGPLPRIGQRFGQFELLEQIGQGGFGAVYRARNPQLDREVALKLPRPGMLEDAEEVARFLREAQAAAQLHHPYIVAVYDAGQISGTYYIASAYIAGMSLRQALKDWQSNSDAQIIYKSADLGRLFPQREAASLVAKLAGALNYAHQKGIFHRDVKPENIMLDAAGEPHLMDFGLARRTEGDTLRTTEGIKMGTPAYMSPEQAKGASHLADARSDLWSLGVILYELLVDRLPFQSKQLDILLLDIIHHEPDSPRKLDKSISKDLETICLKCLAKEPVRRYPTCQHLADELERWLTGKPISARPIGLLERSWLWAKRRPAVAALSSALLVLLTVALVAAPIVAVQQSLLRSKADKSAADSTKAANDLNLSLAKLGRSNEENKKVIAERNASLQSRDDLNRELESEKKKAEKLNKDLQDSLNQLSPQLAAAMFEFAAAEYRAGRIREALARLGNAYDKTPSDDPVRASARRLVVAWSLPQGLLGNPIGKPMIHNKAVNDAAFSPDGRMLVTGCWDGSVRLWDAHTGEPLSEPLRSGDRVTHVAFSPDNRFWLSVGANKSVRWWKVQSQSPVVSAIELDAKISAASFSPNSRIVMAATANEVQLWQAENGQPFGQAIKPVQGTFVTAMFSPDLENLRLATCSSNGVVQLWDGQTGQPVGSPVQHASPIKAFAFAPDGNLLLTGCTDDTARCVEIPSGKAVGIPLQHLDVINSVVFSRDGKKVLTCSDDQTARVWNVETGQIVDEPLRHNHPVKAATFSSDAQTVLTRCDDGTIQLWDTTTCKPLCLHQQQKGSITTAMFSPDGTLVLVAADDGNAQLWKVPQALPDDPEQIDAWVAVTSELFVNERGKTEPIPAEQLQEAKKKFQVSPGDFQQP